MFKQIVLATSNTGKLVELQTLLDPVQCISQHTLGINNIEETGLSFIENAILKARHASSMSNKPALADDSGLVVAALQGKPGIYSARFAGTHATDTENIALLLAELERIEQRQAYFYCALALVQHAEDPTPILATGVFSGKIAYKPAGNNGFGYDPVFYIPTHQCTMAQLPSELKNKISHRALALHQLKLQLSELQN